MGKIIDKMQLWMLIVLAIALGLAPFTPIPHLYQKYLMLINSELVAPIDIADLVFHGFFPLLLLVKLLRLGQLKLRGN